MPARIASGLLAATSFANARASSRGANPCREAGKAPRLAYRSRCARRRSALPPCRRVGAQQPAHQHYAGHVGDQAHLISMTDSCAQEPTKRMSAPRQSWNPPPKATPCTAAITGTGISRQTLTSCWPSGQNISRVPGRPPKARPPPESTTPRTPFCVLSFSSVATSARTSHRQGVHVVCARQAHVCEAFVQINRDTIIHEWSSNSADEGAHLPSFTNLFFSRLVCPWSRNSRHYDLRRIKDA